MSNNKSIFGIPSILLDILRLSAAMTVFITHAIGVWNPLRIHNPNQAGDYAHGAVIIFFVLSGYVISYTTSKNINNFVQYFKSRIGRLYSVLIPGLTITVLIHIFIFLFYKNIFFEYDRGYNLFRYIVSGCFFNEIWFFSSAPLINGPIWSLGFEFWYYIIFGLWFYKFKTKFGKIIVLLACFIAGPKILAMFPIWILGVLAYRIKSPIKNRTLSWWLLIICFLIACYCLIYNPPYPTLIGYPPLFYAGQFITDYVLGLWLALGLWIMPDGKKNDDTGKAVFIFRKIADLTFPIYVLHNPLLILFKAIVEFKPNDSLQLTSAIITVLVICSIIGYYLNENRRKWNKIIQLIFDFIIKRYKVIKVRA